MVNVIHLGVSGSPLETVISGLTNDSRVDSVHRTDSPQQAMSLISEGGHDILVSEYELSDIDGLALLKELRSQGSDVHVLMVLGPERLDAIAEVLQNGADYHILNGVEGHELDAFIQKALRAIDVVYKDAQAKSIADLLDSIDTGLMIFKNHDPVNISTTLEYINRSAEAYIHTEDKGTDEDMDDSGIPPVSFIRDILADIPGTIKDGFGPYPSVQHDYRFGDSKIPFKVHDLGQGRIGVAIGDMAHGKLCDFEQMEMRAEAQRRSAIGMVMDESVSKAYLPDAYHRITRGIAECLGASRVSIWMLDDQERLEKVSVHLSDILDIQTPKREADQISGLLIEVQERNMVRVDDTSEYHPPSSEFLEYLKADDVRSFIAVGIRVSGGLTGILLIESIGKSRPWYNDEEAFIGNISALTGQMLTVNEKEAMRGEIENYSYLLSHVIEDAFAGVAVHDRDMNYLYVSKKYLEDWSLEGQDVIGRNHYEVIPYLPQELRDVHSRVLKGAREQMDLSSFIHPDGRKNWSRWKCIPWYDRGEEIGGLVVYTEFIDKYIEGQEELRKSQEVLDLITENLWETVSILSMDLRFTYVSDNIVSLRGYTVDEAMNQSLSDVLTPESLELVMGNLAEAIEVEAQGKADPKKVIFLDTVQYHKDGHTVDVEIKAAFIRDADGRPSGIIVLSRDVTEMRRSEAELRRTEQRHRTLMEATGVGAWEYRLDGAPEWRSPQYYTMLGYVDVPDYRSDSEGPEGPWSNLIHPEDREHAVKSFNDYLKSGSTEIFEISYRARRADGSYAFIKSRGRRISDENGSPAPVVYGLRIDMTRDMDIQEAIQESRSRLEDIIENLPDPTIVLSSEGKVWQWNQEMERLTGVPKEDIIGKGDYEYALHFYGERRPILADIAMGLDEGKRLYEKLDSDEDILTVDDADVVLNGKDRKLWAMARPLFDLRGNLIGSIESVRDVTEIKMVEESFKRMNRQLNLMTSITRHDVLNQTMALKGFLELMKDDATLRSEKQIDMLMAITNRISELIRFTKIYDEIGSKDPIWQSIRDIVPTIKELGPIEYRVDLDDVEVYADPLLRRIFDNLLDNSLRHGGDVSQIRVHNIIDDDGMTVVWEDDGAGVPYLEKEKIFIQGRGRNTGMGLYITRDILSITGMTIMETGEPGKGARFEIHVPKGKYRYD